MTSEERVQKVKPFQNGKFWTLFEMTPNLAAAVVIDGIITVTTERFQRLFGYNSDELNGMHFRLITDPLDFDTDDKLYHSLLLGERNSYTLQKRYIPKRGLSNFDAVLYVAALHDENEHVIAVINIIRPLPHNHKILDTIRNNLSQNELQEKAQNIIDNSEDVAVRASSDYVDDDKRPFSYRLGVWVIRFVDTIKGLNFVQCLLVAFLALLSLIGFMGWWYLEAILETLKN